MMSAADDGFLEILPASKSPKAACVVGVIEFGKKKTRSVSIVFRLGDLPDDVAKLLREGPRFDVAYNPIMRVVRLLAKPLGRFELVNCPRGRQTEGDSEEADTTAVMLRFPFPASGMRFGEGRHPAVADANLQQKAVLIDLPPPFHPPAPNAHAPQHRAQPLARADVTADLMGDPPRSRSALSLK